MHRNDRLMICLLAAMQLATMYWVFVLLDVTNRALRVCP